MLLFEQKPDFLCLCKEMEHNLMEVMIESALDAIKQKISVKMHLPQSSLLVFLTLLISSNLQTWSRYFVGQSW